MRLAVHEIARVSYEMRRTIGALLTLDDPAPSWEELSSAEREGHYELVQNVLDTPQVVSLDPVADASVEVSGAAEIELNTRINRAVVMALR